MSLKITVKPNESTRIGRSSVKVVSDNISTLIIDGEVPVLRSEYMIDLDQVHTSTQRLHYVLQEMYLCEDMQLHITEYFSLITQILRQDPDAGSWIRDTNDLLIGGQIYKAVKTISFRSHAEGRSQNIERLG